MIVHNDIIVNAFLSVACSIGKKNRRGRGTRGMIVHNNIIVKAFFVAPCYESGYDNGFT